MPRLPDVKLSFEIICSKREDVLDPEDSRYDNEISIIFRVVEELTNIDNEVVESKNLDRLSRDWSHLRLTFPSPDFVSTLLSSVIEAGLPPEYTDTFVNRLVNPQNLVLCRKAAGMLMVFKRRVLLKRKEKIRKIEETMKSFDEFKIPEQCSICLEKMCPEVKLKLLACSHIFHSECITMWLRRNQICPLCRFKLPIATSSSTPEL